MIVIRNIIKSAKDNADFANGIIRLHNSWIDANKKDKEKFVRRQAVVITNMDNGNSIVRMVLGSNGIPGLNKSAAVLDYDGIDALGFRYDVYDGAEIRLEVKKASPMDVFLHFWNHPDIGYRTAHQIAVVSLAMGLTGLLLGMVALF